VNLETQLIFFFSALGAFNSTILSVYFLFFAKPKQLSNYFLGGLLVVLSIRIWKSIFFYFNPDLSKTYLQIGLTACLFIGPLLYFYVKSKLQDPKRVLNQALYLLLPFVVLSLVFGLLYPYTKYPDLWGLYFYKVINYIWLLFLILTGLLCAPLFKKIGNKKQQFDYHEIWIFSVFCGVFLIWLAYFTSSYTSYIIGALSFSFVLYLTILLIFYKRKTSFTITEKKEKYASNKINEEEAQLLLSNIETVLKEEHLYKDPNLTLTQLSKKIHVRSHLVSQLLNDNLHKNFPNFINEYRIEAAKKLLITDKHLKMEVIAESCGFNSTSTFYTAFKNITNTTPGKYAKSKLN